MVFFGHQRDLRGMKKRIIKRQPERRMSPYPEEQEAAVRELDAAVEALAAYRDAGRIDLVPYEEAENLLGEAENVIASLYDTLQQRPVGPPLGFPRTFIGCRVKVFMNSDTRIGSHFGMMLLLPRPTDEHRLTSAERKAAAEARMVELGYEMIKDWTRGRNGRETTWTSGWRKA